MFSTLLGLTLLSGAAQAAPWAEVDAIWAPDASGQWRRVEDSGAAVRVGEEAEEVLKVGLDLDEGDRIRTTQARVRVRLRNSSGGVRTTKNVAPADGPPRVALAP